MSWLRQFVFCLAAGAAVSIMAQNPPPVSPVIFPPGATNLFPSLRPLASPVSFFRQLLAMSPAERIRSLTNRPPETRARILAKVREYQLLGADERELRLRATELRWYLTPLLRVPAAERGNRLALVPEDLRGLIQSRLAQWDLLPKALQQEFLANDKALHYFAHVEGTNQPAATPEQQKITEQFNQFLELTPAEKQQTLNTLSAAEREQMEKTLKSFERLPAIQRSLCLRNYAKFAGMAPSEQAEFLKNAESWSKLTPKERQAWRDLVAQVPMWPPLPIMPTKLILPAPPAIVPQPTMATNFK